MRLVHTPSVVLQNKGKKTQLDLFIQPKGRLQFSGKCISSVWTGLISCGVFSITIVTGRLSYIAVEGTREKKTQNLSFIWCIITQKVSTLYMYPWKRHENQPCMNHCSHQMRQWRGEVYALGNKSPLLLGKRRKKSHKKEAVCNLHPQQQVYLENKCLNKC